MNRFLTAITLVLLLAQPVVAQESFPRFQLGMGYGNVGDWKPFAVGSSGNVRWSGINLYATSLRRTIATWERTDLRLESGVRPDQVQDQEKYRINTHRENCDDRWCAYERLLYS